MLSLYTEGDIEADAGTTRQGKQKREALVAAQLAPGETQVAVANGKHAALQGAVPRVRRTLSLIDSTSCSSIGRK